MPTLQAYNMTYTAISAIAKTGLTSQSRLTAKKALAVAPALKLVSAPALSQTRPRPKVSRPTPQPSLLFHAILSLTSPIFAATERLDCSMPASRRINFVSA
jgi:hypothetical protein